MGIKYTIYKLVFYLFRIIPIQENKIVISSYAGKGYGDNGKYVADALLKREKDFDIVWLCSDKEARFPNGIRKVKYKSVRSVYEQVTAKVWIDNRRKREYVRKRKNQYYIMTWHGGIALKKVEKEAGNSLSKEYIRAAKKDSQMADLFLAESEWTQDWYRRSFWYDGEILLCGAPRQDILFQNDSTLISKVKRAVGVKDNIHILLYAPTFREEMKKEILSVYDLHWDEVLQAMESKFGGIWMGMFRLHPNISDLADAFLPCNNVIDVTDYPDMQELLLISDCVITDYSSSIIEFGVTGKPGFIYAKDMDDYVIQRGLALNYQDLPFPVALDSQKLIYEIKMFDRNTYSQRITDFYYRKCGLQDGGHASEIVADRIEQVIEESRKGIWSKRNTGK